MTTSLAFSKEHHPELLSVPLKGRFLKDFVLAAKEAADLQLRQINGGMLPSLQTTMLRKAADLSSAVLQKISGKLDSDAAQNYGIDANDLMGIIRREAGTDAQNIDLQSSMEQMLVPAITEIQTGEAPPMNKKNPEFDAAIMEVTATSLMQLFSMCLAVQEGKERFILDGAEQSRKEGLQQISQLRFHPEFGDVMSGSCLGAVIGTLLSTMQLASDLRKKSSLIAPLHDQILFGENYKRTGEIGGAAGMVDDVIAILHNLDPDKAADREEMRRIKKLFFEEISKATGIPLPEQKILQ